MDEFQQAVAYVNSLPKDGPVTVTNADKLQLYGWYKRVTAGDALPERPGMLAFESKSKWDAWDARGIDDVDDGRARDGRTSFRVASDAFKGFVKGFGATY